MSEDSKKTDIAEDETSFGLDLDPSDLAPPGGDDDLAGAKTGVRHSTQRDRPGELKNQTAPLRKGSQSELGVITGGIDEAGVDDPLPSGTVIDDHYEILDHLGAGGMGSVYRAKDLRLGRLVAIKAMSLIPDIEVDEQLRVFKRDAVATAQLRHPNVVTIFDYGVHDDTPYIVLELLEGEPLDNVIAEYGALPLERALGVTAQILAALAHAHDAGVLHRDLKPANVFLVEHGPVKVLDFGMADLDVSRSQLKAALGKQTEALKLEFGDAPVGGSPAYMAPEQWRHDTQSTATDLWALGVILHEMTTGKLPFDWQGMRKSSWGLQPAPRIPEVVSSAPDDVRELIERLLAWDPAKRAQDARSVAREVEDVSARVQKRLRQPTRIRKGTVIEDRFELLDRIGAGGFGVVFKARQTSTEQIVAIKLLHGAPAHASEEDVQIVRERFKREMTLIARLRHPNIVRLIDYGELADHQAYIVLEFIEGTPLSKLLREEGGLSAEETRHLMGQVLDALAAAHEQGVVHRDLKPDNIIVTTAGGRRNAMVLDFGIASIVDEDGSAYQKLTKTNEVVGTPSYMAPEQLLGKGVTDRSDLYAWGLVALECLTGETVVDAESGAAVIFKHLSGDPVPIDPDVEHTPLGQLLRRTVDKDPETRFPNAKDLLVELQALDLEAKVEKPATGIHDKQTGAMTREPAPEPEAQHVPIEETLPTHRIDPVESAETTTFEPIEEKSNTGLLVIIGLLMLAIGGAVAFLVIQSGDDEKGDGSTDEARATSETTTSTDSTTTAGTPDPITAPATEPTTPTPEEADVAEPASNLAVLATTPVPAAAVSLGLDGTQISSLAATYPVFEFDAEFSVRKPGAFARPALDVMTDEVTWAQWLAAAPSIDAVQASCGGPRPQRPANLTDDAAPVVGVGAAEAAAFCAAHGMRLPSAKEWEAIASGEAGRLYAFGDAIAPDRDAALRASPWPTPAWNATPEGVRALTAGVAEWTTCEQGVIGYCKDGYMSRGGSWQSDAERGFWLNAAAAEAPPSSPACARLPDTGFRCVKDAAP